MVQLNIMSSRWDPGRTLGKNQISVNKVWTLVNKKKNAVNGMSKF